MCIPWGHTLLWIQRATVQLSSGSKSLPQTLHEIYKLQRQLHAELPMKSCFWMPWWQRWGQVGGVLKFLVTCVDTLNWFLCSFDDRLIGWQLKIFSDLPPAKLAQGLMGRPARQTYWNETSKFPSPNQCPWHVHGIAQAQCSWCSTSLP